MVSQFSDAKIAVLKLNDDEAPLTSAQPVWKWGRHTLALLKTRSILGTAQRSKSDTGNANQHGMVCLSAAKSACGKTPLEAEEGHTAPKTSTVECTSIRAFLSEPYS